MKIKKEKRKMDKSKWEYKKCNEVFDLFMGKTPSRRDLSLWNDGSHPWVSISDMEGKYISKTKEAITDKAIEKMQEVPANTAIMSFKLTIGRTAITKKPLYTNEAIMAFPVKRGYNIDPNYLYYYLPKVRWTRSSNRAVMGYTLNKKSISDTTIAIPPLSTQHQIVSELDQLSDLISLKQQQIKEYDVLAQSLFYEMFGDPLVNDKNYDCKKLGQVTKVGSSKRVFSTEFVDSGIPFFRGTEIAKIADGTFEEPTLFITKEHYENLIAVTGKPEVGDLLLPSICPNERIMIVNNNKPFYIKDGRVLWIRANMKKFNSIYLKFALGEILTLDYNKYASGATFKELKIFTLSSVPIPLPPLPLQQSFASKVQAIEHQKSLLKQNIAETQTLLDSRMQEYFG